VTEAHVCEQLAQGCYLKVERPGVEPATSGVANQHANHYVTRLHTSLQSDQHLHSAAAAASDRHLLQAGARAQQQTRARRCCRSTGQTDRRTDTRLYCDA